MITANYYTKVEFDEDGRQKIEEAAITLQEVSDAISKVNINLVPVELREAATMLWEILDGDMWF